MKDLSSFPLPSPILQIVKGLDYERDETGKSNSQVLLFEDYVLKISSLPFDIENEMKVYQALKDKLPIPEIVACEVMDGHIYLLKKKLKGKPLSDETYMRNPVLLYSLATQALKMLWSIDISLLSLQNTYETVLQTGQNFYHQGLLDIRKSDSSVTSPFASFSEIFDYLKFHKPSDGPVLSHGDLCLPNIICDGDKLAGFIDLGLTGISHRYHDLAILYRSIRNNFSGAYGKAYEGYDEGKLFSLMGVEKDNDLIYYFLLLDEVLG